MKSDFKKEKEGILKLHEIEIEIHERKYKQTKEKLDYNMAALSKIKHVLKVPRLCKIF